MDALVFDFGALLVFVVAFQRFNTVPPPAPELPVGVPLIVGTVLSWFRWGHEARPDILPPPRAETTAFKFWLYRLTYSGVTLAVYVLVCTVPGIAAGVQQAMAYFAHLTNVPSVVEQGRFWLAILVSTVLPSVPPFKGAERSLRRTLYEHAFIPAQQLRERKRLELATFTVDPTELSRVQARLGSEGFDSSDIVYAGGNATRELWTKAAILMDHIGLWEATGRYATACSVLREHDGTTRSIDKLREMYEALKGDAKTCFRLTREQVGSHEALTREETFRRDLRALLDHAYHLLSRVSLHAHLTEHERVTSFSGIGFRLQLPPVGPIPDANDLFALGLLVVFAFLPLESTSGVFATTTWAAGVVVAVLIPLVIASEHFEFAMTPSHHTPAIAFPMVAGMLAMAMGALTGIFYGGIIDASGASFSLRAGISRFMAQSYPWTLLHFTIASLIACMTRRRFYPNVATLRGFRRYRAWGSIRDGLVLSTGLMIAMKIVLNAVARLRPGFDGGWRPYTVAAVLGGTIGFFVPTWYRANLARIEGGAGQSSEYPTTESPRAAA